MRLNWTRRAQADLEAIWLFLAERSPDFADRVEARINDRANALTLFPILGRRDGTGGWRLLSITDIQYLIEYRVDDELVTIAHVWSTAQDRRDIP